MREACPEKRNKIFAHAGHSLMDIQKFHVLKESGEEEQFVGATASPVQL